MGIPEPGSDDFDQLLDVAGFLPGFLDEGNWLPTTPLEDLVLATLARWRGTYETIMDLVASGRTLQAAMLGRSLFEDMIVSHWLVLHRDDPGWLVERFVRHRDAMRLRDHDVRVATGLEHEGDDVSDLLLRADDLRGEFGRHAERDWWGSDRAGNRVTMATAVARLSEATMFRPRLKGEAPVLHEYFLLQQKAWTQALHHTAAGTEMRAEARGNFPAVSAAPSAFSIVFGNYWVLGQTIAVTLDLGAEGYAERRFEELFLAGLAVFGVTAEIDDHLLDGLERHLRDDG